MLRANGRYVAVGAPKGRWIKPLGRVIMAMMYSKLVNQDMGMMLTRASKDDLVLLADLVQQGKVTPVIDKTYKLSEAAEAMRHLESGTARGKIVIQLY